MCQDALHPFLAALPKCEHHLHLEGSLSPELLFQLAAKNGITLPESDPAFASPSALYERYEYFANLDDFLHYYYIGMTTLLDAQDFESLAYAYFVKAASQGVRHAEVFFDPQAHTSRGVSFNALVDGFQAAQRKASIELGLSSELIMCLLKHLPLADALSTFEMAHAANHFHNGSFAGIGMDSSEVPFPPPMWKDLFDVAKAAGVRRTIHAGEEAAAHCVTQALDILSVQRIDHGRTAADDPELLARLSEEQIMLTTCPLSNLKLQGIKEMKDFPLRKFLDAGVRISINSDDPAYFGGYILENYCALQENFNLDIHEWVGIAKGAVLGSWCSEERKAEILSEIDDLLSKWTEKAA
jgi:adenosine deaminase